MKTIHEVMALPLSVPVVEQTSPWPFIVKASDVRNAVPLDPCKCVVAKAVRRTWGGAAVIMRELAYVEMRDPKGRTLIGKFSVPKPVRDAIGRFDETREFPADVALYLGPIYPSKRAASRRLAEKLLRQDRRSGNAPPAKPRVLKGSAPQRARLFDVATAVRLTP